MSGKDPALNRIMKSLWNFSVDNNMNLHLLYMKSEDNPADCHSRRLSALDYMLTGEKFETIEQRFGPHSVDLMSLDSNCKISKWETFKAFHTIPDPIVCWCEGIFSGYNIGEESIYISSI